MLISDQLDTIQKGIVQDVTVDVEVMQYPKILIPS